MAGAGEAENALDYMMNHLGLGCLCRTIEDLLSFPSADDELAGLEIFQMVRDCGACHAGSL